MDEQKRQAAEKVEDVSLSGRTYLQLVTDGLKAVPFKESSFSAACEDRTLPLRKFKEIRPSGKSRGRPLNFRRIR
jgi:hypothetical protein